jgi:hypothetical protein
VIEGGCAVAVVLVPVDGVGGRAVEVMVGVEEGDVLV